MLYQICNYIFEFRLIYASISYILAQTKVHFLDVDEDYFLKHVTRLPTRYRDKLINWSEVDQSRGYSQPFYTDESTVRDDA